MFADFIRRLKGRVEDFTPEQLAAYKERNELNLRNSARKGLPVVKGMPLKATLNLTLDCNFSCRMCPCPPLKISERKNNRELAVPRESFEANAAKILPHVRVINPTVVGEPLRVPYIDLLCELASRWQTRIEWITNGQLLDQKMIERVGPQTSTMLVSLDGATKETFESIRKGGHFETVTENIMRFDKWRRSLPENESMPGLRLCVVLMKENIQELPGIIRMAKRLNVDTVNAAYMVVHDKSMEESSLLKHKALANACLVRADKTAKDLGIKVSLPTLFTDVSEEEVKRVQVIEPAFPDGLLPHLKGSISENVSARPLRDPAPVQLPENMPPACNFLWSEVYVYSSGYVDPCCIGSYHVGNIFEEDLKAIWNGKRIQELRRLLLNGTPHAFCRNCIFTSQFKSGEYFEEKFFVDKSEH